MKIYSVTLIKGYNKTEVTLNVAANSMAQALEYTDRYAKKSYYADIEVTHIEKRLDVAVHYSSGSTKKRK